MPCLEICRCEILHLRQTKQKCLCGGSRLTCCSGRRRPLQRNITVWSWRVVWGKIRDCGISVLLNVSARASRGATAMQWLCQHSWGSTRAKCSHLSPPRPEVKENLIDGAHWSFQHTKLSSYVSIAFLKIRLLSKNKKLNSVDGKYLHCKKRPW